jgi:acyl-CoA reductase-like NAD-dependent aldehyde dehydrogenase
LNGGATCIAPRRVFVSKDRIRELEGYLLPLLAELPGVTLAESVKSHVVELLTDALQRGAQLSEAPPSEAVMAPTVVLDAKPESKLLNADIMAPVIALIAVDDTEQALAIDAHCAYALSAAVFGPEQDALALAARVRAGSVTINDLIVPTPDARLPFGGRGESGYGVTRGGAGLLEFTTIKTVSVRHGRFRPHYDPPAPGDQALFMAYLQAFHGKCFKKRRYAFGRLLRYFQSRND